MKTTCWLICGTMLGTSILAQDNTNSLPPMPPPLTAPEAAPAPAAPQAVPAPAAPKKARAAKKKKAAPRHRLFEPTVSLTPGPAEVKAKSLIVRGQPGFKGESITHLSQGETVNVLDEITLKHHVVGEPRQWAKIALPSSAHVWVDSKFIGPDGAVKPKKLNLRAGPGENYGVVGTLEQGATVNQIRTKGHWMEVAPPPNAFAFVAAMYLKPAPEAAVAPQPAPPPSEVMPQPAPVPEQPVMPAPETAPGLELTPERIATHEGVVRHTVSPITPTAYELYSL
ncbi:MAG: hypothetical protein KGR98_15355, partial [Verrucomicrobia bacterium]|nr:hypothetical protein [Verrucomicrobiota bacterium]